MNAEQTGRRDLKPSDGIVVIQARVGSTRLPGKSVARICGRPSLKLLLERLDGCEASHIIVATSDKVLDDSVETVVESHEGVRVIRGSESDVLSRFVTAIREYQPRFVIRLTADNPTVNAWCVNRAIEEYLKTDEDVAHLTNHAKDRTDPFGLAVEVADADALVRVAEERSEERYREHVTLALIERDEFRSESFCLLGDDHADLCWTVDTWEQLVSARELFETSGPEASIEQLVRNSRT